MKKRKQIPLALVLAVVILIAAVAGYMLVIRPKAAEVEKLDGEIAALQTQIQTTRRAIEKLEEPAPPTSIKVADVVELAKAMPDDTDMAGAILELHAAAEAAGVGFASITPGQPTPGAGYVQYPLTLSFLGHYYELTELLYQLRQLVTVREGVLDADGRLFTLDTVDWREPDVSELSFPWVQADLVVSVYVYGNDPTLLVPTVPGAQPGTAPAPAPATTAPTDEGGNAPTTTAPTDTSTTTTTPPTTTDSAPVDASQQAAGVTP